MMLLNIEAEHIGVMATQVTEVAQIKLALAAQGISNGQPQSQHEIMNLEHEQHLQVINGY